MKYTDGVPSPDIFRLWSGITAISGALERRVWVETSRSVLFPNLFTLLVAPPAVGKCLAYGEHVLTYDGKAVPIETVKVGDLLIGPDGKSRTVIATAPGEGQLYKVTPTKGRSWLCNGEHILSLRKSKNPNRGEICTVTVLNWLKWSNTKKAEWKLWRVEVKDFALSLPKRKDATNVGFNISLASQGRWWGIEVDQDRQFLLDDFTVIHNTQAINPVEQLWYANAQKFHVAPNNVTKASLIDSLMKADRKLLAPDKSLIEYHTMLIAASEFGVLVPSHDLEFLSVLNYVYDNPKSYREERRTMARSIDICNPQLVILAATQPGYLAATLPEEAWSMGTTSRLIMVYSGTGKHVPLFGKGENRQEEFKALAESLGAMSERVGAFQWDEDAAKEIERWYLGGCDPVPEHSKLTHYNGRRILHILKLCMISAMSRSPKLRITLLDLTRAKDWLLAAEATMPDIFKEMVSKSDGQVIQEMHFFMWQIWVKDKKPVHESRIINFLSQRVPSEKIHRVIEIAERSNVISRMAGTQTYTPRPKNSHGLE